MNVFKNDLTLIMVKFYFLVILTVFTAIAAQAQNYKSELFAIQPQIGYGLNFYQADFKSFQGAVDCGDFTSGNGSGITAGIFFEKAFSDNMMVALGGSYIDRSGTLILQTGFPSRDYNTGRAIFVKTENRLKTNISFIEIEPRFYYQLLDNLINGPFRLDFGIRMGLMNTKTFDQKEVIIEPDNAVFINAGNKITQERQIALGDINTASGMTFGVSFGVENMLKAGSNNFFTQSVIFDYNFNNFVSDADWKGMGVKVELGYRFSISKPTKPEPIPPVEPETPKAPEPEPVVIAQEKPQPIPTLNVKVDVLDLNSQKIETGNELLATVPIVNAVFFDLNSSEIPAGYNLSELNNPDFYNEDPVKFHSQILPRIAWIVSKNAKAQIELEAATSGAKTEPEGLALAEKRGESVKTALINLGVPENKIKVAPKVNPQFQSNPDFEEGLAENRRVDINIKNAPLQEFVNFQKFAEVKGKVKVKVDFDGLDDTKPVVVTTDLGNEPIKLNKPETITIPFEKRIEENQSTLVVTAHAEQGDVKNNAETVIPLNKLAKNNVETELGNFRAVLRFNYNSSELSDENKALLTQMANLLPEGSTIYILGSTDDLGSAERNAKLEKERAENTQKVIKSASNKNFNIETGRNEVKFDQSTPQGRFLNRSIIIRVK